MDMLFICYLMILGAITGFMAGLLGIGGGGIMVPVLTSLFLWRGIDADGAVHLALGTSMASIVMTSLASMRAHHRKQGVHWHVVRSMAPGILIGTFIATFIASVSSGAILAGIFAVFMTGVALQLVSGARPTPGRQLPGAGALMATGGGIGGISALVSIGGGTLSVPFLYWHNVPMKQAIGTSAAIGFPIAVSGTLGYIVNGWQQVDKDALTLGFIYLPAVVAISIFSVLTAPLGVKLAYRLPVSVMKKIFALLVFGLAVKMFISVAF